MLINNDVTPMPTGFVPRTTTVGLVDEVLETLTSRVDDVACELFPDSPSNYRLNHPTGAYLLAWSGSKFGLPVDTFMVAQDRTVSLTFNVLARQLYGRDGAVALCDKLRDALVGWQPTGCDKKIYAVSEQFLGEEDGIWLYQVVLATVMVSLPRIY